MDFIFVKNNEYAKYDIYDNSINFWSNNEYLLEKFDYLLFFFLEKYFVLSDPSSLFLK